MSKICDTLPILSINIYDTLTKKPLYIVYNPLLNKSQCASLKKCNKINTKIIHETVELTKLCTLTKSVNFFAGKKQIIYHIIKFELFTIYFTTFDLFEQDSVKDVIYNFHNYINFLSHGIPEPDYNDIHLKEASIFPKYQSSLKPIQYKLKQAKQEKSTHRVCNLL